MIYYFMWFVVVVRFVVEGKVDWVILICGIGLGVVIVVNKVKGIRVVMVYDSYSVEKSIVSNNV